MKTTRNVIAITSILLVPCAAHAQVGPSVNRKAEAISVQLIPVEGGGGPLYDVFCYGSVEASDLTAPANVSTTIELRRNGTAVFMDTFDLTANPETHGDCSGLGCSGPCICTPPPMVCECGPTLVQAGGRVPLQPHDEIMILLYPAPGAVPDSDPSDDQVILPPWDGQELIWNRRIDNLTITPSAVPEGVGDQFFDITVDVSEQARYPGRLNLDAVLQLSIDGVPHSSLPLDLTHQWTICDATCAGNCVFDKAVPVGTCATVNPYGCLCVFGPVGFGFQAVPVDPGGTVDVTLVPVPGALPELPGFPNDDEEEQRVCPWDCGNGDLIVGIEDFLELLAQWNQVGTSCDFDGNGVDINDFLELLANWGPCFDV